MKDILISAEGVQKKFCRSLRRSMVYGTVDIVRDMLGRCYETGKLRPSEFWAVRDVSFNVRRGEKLGFLGINGSGKSTLLRMINGIFPPDGGRITIRGSIGALIAVGVGFHPHMSGRENIFLNGTILGMSRAEIRSKMNSILDFAEIGDAIDAPVSTYSSGMTVRLGFAIAIHKQPDIMLVDEVLSVGDLAFQLKCQRRLSEYRQAGGTFVIVSHNMQLMRNTCDRVIWFEKGRIVMEGDVHHVCDEYESAQLRSSLLNRKGENDKRGELPRKVLNYDSRVGIDLVQLLDHTGVPTTQFVSGSAFCVRIEVRTERVIEVPILTVALRNSDGLVVFECYSTHGTSRLPPIRGSSCVEFFIDSLNIKPDIYSLSITLCESDILGKLEWHEGGYDFAVVPGPFQINQGLIHPYPRWSEVSAETV